MRDALQCVSTVTYECNVVFQIVVIDSVGAGRDLPLQYH